MARIQNVLFGKLAVSTRFITEQQLEECLQEQRRLEAAGEQPPRLGELLEQKGYLTKQQIRSILETMASMQRRLFGEIGIAFHFITLEQLQTALDVQRFLKSPMDSVPLFGQALIAYRGFLKSARDGGGPVPKIGEILLAMGYLKEHQVQVVLEEQNKKIVQCKSCGAGLNIGKFTEGQKLRCGQCSSVLVLERNQFGELDATLPKEDEPLPQVTRHPTEARQMLAVGAPSASAPGTSATPAAGVPAVRPGTAAQRPSQIAKSPTIFGDFTIQSKLGQDSTGMLYKAQQASKGRACVVKIMNQSVMQDAAFAKRFTDEARKVAGLVHPNIKKIYAIGQVDGRAYMAMEYVEGESVHAILTRQTRIHHTQTLRIGKRICEALKYAWDTGKILHGDIRPSNVLVLKTGEVMLSNLGLATKTAENILTIAKSGQLAPFYLAPELVTEDRAIDCRSDIYSLGATLYHMIAGRPPYQGQSPFEVLVRLTEERVAPLKFFDATIPDAVCVVVEKMLAVEPDERYQSYDDLLHDLSKIEEVSADVDASMLLGERPSKTRKTTVQLMAVGGEVSAVPGGASDLVKKKTTTVIRGDSAAGEVETAPTRSGTPIFVWIGVAAVVLGGAFFLMTSQQGSTQEDDDFLKCGDECRSMEAGDRYEEAIARWNDFLSGHPGTSKAPEVQAQIAHLEGAKASAADRDYEQLRNDIEQTARKDGIPPAQRLLEPGQIKQTLLQPKFEGRIEELRNRLKELAKEIFEAGKKEAWEFAKEKHDPDGARQKLQDLRNKVPEFAEQLDQELAAFAKWEEEDKKQKEKEAAKKREEDSAKKLEQIRADVDDLAKEWNFEGASARCTREVGDLLEKDQQAVHKVEAEIEALRQLRDKAVEHWSFFLAENANPPIENDPRPVISLDQKEYHVVAMSPELIDLKDKDGRLIRKPWKDVPMKPFYEKVLGPAVANATTNTPDLHLALGTVLLRNLLLAEAEKEFLTAADQGKDVDFYTKRIDETFSREAEKCLGDARTYKKNLKWKEALRCALRLRGEFGERTFYKQNEKEIAALTEECFRALAEGGADYYGFADGTEIGKWKQEKEGVWACNGTLTGAGRNGTITLETKGVQELSMMLELPDARSRFTVRIGKFKAEFRPAEKKVTLQGPTGRNPRDFVCEPGHWYLVRIAFVDQRMVLWLDEKEVGGVPAQGMTSQDDVSLQIEGGGGGAEGKVLIDHLVIAHEK